MCTVYTDCTLHCTLYSTPSLNALLSLEIIRQLELYQGRANHQLLPSTITILPTTYNLMMSGDMPDPAPKKNGLQVCPTLIHFHLSNN